MAFFIQFRTFAAELSRGAVSLAAEMIPSKPDAGNTDVGMIEQKSTIQDPFIFMNFKGKEKMKRLFLLVQLGIAMSMQAEGVDTLKSVELQNVQVVATRATKKTPVAYTNMSQEQLKSVNFGQDVPYMLSLTPSVTMTSDAGNGIGYTSLRVRGTDPSRINITANGIPMNDAESATVFWVNMGDFASSVQSMQIQRGVGTSTNGAGAFGATINMQTENIGINPFIGVDLSAGSYYSHKEVVTGAFRDACQTSVRRAIWTVHPPS